MQKLISQISTLSLGLVIALGSAVTVVAQTNGTDDGNFQSNEKDSLYGDSTLGVDPIDLIHNYNLRVGRSAQEFSESSGAQIQDSAAEFKRLQQERMLQQQQDNSNSEVNVP